MTKSLTGAVRAKLDEANRILLTAHARPDGDAIGSVLAFGIALQDAGYEVQMVLSDSVPAALRFLPGSDQVVTSPKGEFDLVITLDLGNMERIGATLKKFSKIDINIDHHPDNSNYGEINIVDPEAVSVTEMLTDLLPELGLEITQPVATNLLAGLITDTLGLRTQNMRPAALRKAADLFEKGADLPELYFKTQVQRSFTASRYWGAGLSKLARKDGLVWASLSLEDRKSVNYSGRDDADLVNILSAIDDAVVAVIFVEQDEKTVKVSWRSRSAETDVSKVAHQFDGGGHQAASGAMVTGSLREVEEKVVNTTYQMLAENIKKVNN
ncbi:MAG: bifunctional oligoribonuclease/PAP phosphatase NrnA [Chloroflexota bacterium]